MTSGAAQTNPADLYVEMQDLLGQVRQLRRAAGELRREYVALDPVQLATDALGDPVDAPTAVAAVIEGLEAVDRSLGGLDDAFDGPLALGSRLLRPTPPADSGRL